MTPNMAAVQMAVLEIMKACVQELKSSNPAVSDQSDPLLVGQCVRHYSQLFLLALPWASVNFAVAIARYRRRDGGSLSQQGAGSSYQEAVGPCLGQAGLSFTCDVDVREREREREMIY